MILATVGKFAYFAQAATVTVIDGLGGFSTEPDDFTGKLYGIGLGLGGVVAAILVAVGAYSILTSGGDVQKVKDGREQISNAIMGFALILLAVTVIRIVFNTFINGY